MKFVVFLSLLLVSSLSNANSNFSRDDKEAIRDFFLGQSRLSDAVDLAKGVEFSEPPSQFAADLNQAIQETCLMDVEEGDYFSRYEFSGELCVMPTVTTSRTSVGNGYASGEDILRAELRDANFSETTGRRKFENKVQWEFQQAANGQFRGRAVESARHDLVTDKKGLVNSRTDYSGFQDINNELRITHWALGAQIRIGNRQFEVRANINPQVSQCAINNSTISCEELFELVGGKETAFHRVLKYPRNK